jgi:phosphonate transport system ATP-binding protein
MRDGAVIWDGPSSALTNAFLGELYGASADELVLADVGVPQPVPATASAHNPKQPVLEPA